MGHLGAGYERKQAEHSGRRLCVSNRGWVLEEGRVQQSTLGPQEIDMAEGGDLQLWRVMMTVLQLHGPYALQITPETEALRAPLIRHLPKSDHKGTPLEWGWRPALW